ncbi:hypothetical protein MishRS11D_19700 [Methylomagnum ishizawai]|nr:hypothetical protein MishRS11D_19700 [Methylomagnum ishizawai]
MGCPIPQAFHGSVLDLEPKLKLAARSGAGVHGPVERLGVQLAGAAVTWQALPQTSEATVRCFKQAEGGEDALNDARQ